ncbi:MAG TPA: zinc-dependent alcohol dehydrogenase family protein [Streptosporangiaceae bacterium]|nr:zinc-dependent alcohol dehydrogenase family protein [Streptosporangiaceae bacterium]
MRAVVYDDYGLMPELRQVADPVCPDDGAVLSVGATGLCRSDWHAWRGHDPVPLPQIPGHELAGTVIQAGRHVKNWAAGDRVTVPFVCGCGICEYCLAGDAQVCPNQTQAGFTGPGSFAEQVAIRAADLNLVALPESVSFAAAASLGCRFGTAFRAVTVHGQLKAGDWLAVHGCGGVGLSAVMIAAALGGRVIAVDVAPAALDLAAQFGAEHVIDASHDADPAVTIAKITDITNGGAQISIDALGSATTAVNSVRCLRRRGRHLQVGLLLGAESRPPIPMDLVIARELEIYGSHGMPARDYPAMLALITDQRLRPELLVTREITLDEAPAALAAMDQHSTTGGVAVITSF